ncbi:MAG: hypothetical protein JW384_02457 [Nitrosomonadaceae bacterium]|nr:hypothetical protein [Nitrosomonadaceae bacterium]
MTTTNNLKYKTIKRSRGTKWNDNMRDTMVSLYNNYDKHIPDRFLGIYASPMMVNTLLHLGWCEDDVLSILKHTDATGDQPDWSESDWDELLYHFQLVEATMNTGESV